MGLTCDIDSIINGERFITGKVSHVNFKYKTGNKIRTRCNNPAYLTALCYLAEGGDIVETTFEYWISRLNDDYKCLPCCILGEDIHPKMKACSSMPSASDIIKQQALHGRCGIDFNPWISMNLIHECTVLRQRLTHFVCGQNFKNASIFGERLYIIYCPWRSAPGICFWFILVKLKTMFIFSLHCKLLILNSSETK